MGVKKISELSAALALSSTDLFLVSQTDRNSDNVISRKLSVGQFWSEVSSRFVTYDNDYTNRYTLSSDRHHSCAYALSADVSSNRQLTDKFNTLSTYGNIRHQLSTDGYVLSGWVYNKDESDELFARADNVYSSAYVDAHFARASKFYEKTETYSSAESDDRYYVKDLVYSKTESDDNYYRKYDVYSKSETYSADQVDAKFTLNPASASRLGGIKIGSGLSVAQDGTVSTYSLFDLLDKIYPIGSIYLTLDGRNPVQIFGFGIWQRVAYGKCIWGADKTSSNLGNVLSSGLPDIRGSFTADNTQIGTSTEGSAKPPQGAFTGVHLGDFDMLTQAGAGSGGRLHFNASSSNSIYGRSDTVQPPAFVVNAWKRVSSLGPEEVIFTEPTTKAITDPVKRTETYTTESPYSYSTQAKQGNWDIQNELINAYVTCSLPSGCGGSGGHVYVNGVVVASVSAGKTVTQRIGSIAKGSMVSITSGCGAHFITVSMTGTQIQTKTRTVWS